ncbi:hypothetical protein TRIUR3_21975 [Triticum urartu]|uniref:Uncharacterized protein n=1 Tax=Triticum urartu TaxID=4572 RepID=M7ZSE8_TRIUA|nr:hypothetical protein TRIUR3_21975 [Triticum urartu]
MASSDRLGPSRPWSSSPTLARLQRLTRDPARMLVAHDQAPSMAAARRREPPRPPASIRRTIVPIRYNDLLFMVLDDGIKLGTPTSPDHPRLPSVPRRAARECKDTGSNYSCLCRAHRALRPSMRARTRYVLEPESCPFAC